jgi:hypothetical protein
LKAKIYGGCRWQCKDRLLPLENEQASAMWFRFGNKERQRLCCATEMLNFSATMPVLAFARFGTFNSSVPAKQPNVNTNSNSKTAATITIIPITQSVQFK